MEKIRNRDEIPQEDKWAIEDLYPCDEAWEAELETVAEDEAYLASFNGKLENAEHLLAFLTRAEELGVKADRLGNYCMRKSDEDTRNTVYQAMQGKFMSVMVALGAATSFDTPQIMVIEDSVLEDFYAECPGLERYRRYLTDLRRRKAHTLSEAEEKLLSAAGEMAQTPDNIYGAFADADMKFADAVDAEGKTYPLTQGTFRLCRGSAQLSGFLVFEHFGTFGGRGLYVAAVSGMEAGFGFGTGLRWFGTDLRSGRVLYAPACVFAGWRHPLLRF